MKINYQDIKYTDLVFARVNKKLKTDYSNLQIKILVREILEDNNSLINKQGKNYYVYNNQKEIELVINAFSYTLITINSKNKRIVR